MRATNSTTTTTTAFCMNKIKRTLLLAAALPAIMPAPARAATPLADLVGEDAPLVVLVDNVPRLLRHWEGCPAARMLDDPEITGFFNPGHTPPVLPALDGLLRQDFGHGAKELLAFAQGGALFAIPNVEGLAQGRPPVLLIVELGGNAAKLEALLDSKAFREKTRLLRETTSHAGATLHYDRYGGDSGFVMAWSINEGTLYCSPARDLVSGALDRVVAAIAAARAGGAPDAFGKSARHLRMKERAGGMPHALLAVDFREIVPLLDLMLKMQAAGAPGPAAAMLDLAHLTSHLGLDAARDFYVSARLAEEYAEITSGLTCTEERGLLKLMTAVQEGPFAQPPFLAADSLGFATARLSLPVFYDVLEEMLKGASPMMHAMFEHRIAAFNRQNGIDVKRDLLGSLGGDVFMVRRRPPAGDAPPAAPDIAFVLPLKDERLFASTLNTLKKAAGLEDTGRLSARDHLGATIYTLEHGVNPGDRMFHAVVNGHFIIGISSTASAVESVIQGMTGKTASVWGRPEIIESLADVPGDAFAYRYEDTASIMDDFFDAFERLAKRATAAAPPDSPHAKRTLGPKPGAATLEKYWGAMSGFNQRDARGIYIKSRIYYKKTPPPS
ncbi:MAG: hypothetical protein LBC18_01805 [Opitutaceae bacterium]|jgi:hypothetical protein|nr:hypothetical protein [Opitutaceae bacterium]